MSTYFALLTQVGEAKLANAIALGGTLKFTQMGVGDGNGVTPTPNRLQTTLVRENRRAVLNQLTQDPLNASQIIAEQVLPEDVGGWWVREIGLYDDTGALCAVANCPPSYKPLMAEGSGREQVIRVVLVVSSTSAIELKIDPAVVLATRKYVDDAITVYAAPKDHKHVDLAPLESPTFTGMPKVPTAADGTNTDQAASTKFVKKAVAAAIASAVLFATAIPAEKVADAVFVKDVGTLQWVDVQGTGAYSGYRAPEVGRPEFGSTANARAYELDLVGGLAPKAAYASLWAWAQQNGYVVTAANWTSKVFAFVDVDATYFRMPDLRNVFLRFTGTNADTGLARAIGSFQDFLNAAHTHTGTVGAGGNHYHTGSTDAGGYHAHTFLVGNREGAEAKPGNGNGSYANAGTDGAGSHAHSFTTGYASNGDHTHGLTINSSGGAEARPANVAFAPRIHI
ncbi:phage tail protein [Herbaspirillum robiniae]|uniref:phage tail protein n=1 Tax=Herbaspirillum robiniae TaxID=2014887 RepID=UPI003D76E04C